MDNNVISILVISKGKESSRYIHINLRLLKSFLFVFMAIISFLFTSYFYSSGEVNHKSANVVAKTDSSTVKPDTGNTDVLTDTEVVKEFIEFSLSDGELNKGVPIEYEISERMFEVEEKLKNMQMMLKKKGIRKELSVGGEFIGADKLKDDYFDKIENDIENLTRTLEDYPIGMPSDGSISSYFGHRKDPFNKRKAFHSGLDFDSDYGAGVVSTANGRVEKAGWCGGYGKCVVIKHNNGYKTLYGHLSRVKVKRGQKVTSGQMIGNIGSTGRSTGPHLHYEIMKNGKKINPYKYLSLG